MTPQRGKLATTRTRRNGGISRELMPARTDVVKSIQARIPNAKTHMEKLAKKGPMMPALHQTVSFAKQLPGAHGEHTSGTQGHGVRTIFQRPRPHDLKGHVARRDCHRGTVAFTLERAQHS